MCLRALKDTHLKVDGVTHDVHLRRIEPVEQVAIVPISVAHSIFILGKALVQVLLVIHIALLHVEQAAQIVGRIYCIAHPGDVSDIILLSFIHLEQHVYVLGVVVPHAVFQQFGITIAQLVIL